MQTLVGHNLRKTGGGMMAKSGKRHQAEGHLDRVASRVLEAWGAPTGQRSKTAKGKAARTRGRARGSLGRAKKAAK